MKIALISLGIAVLAGAACLGIMTKRKGQRDTDAIDGGVRHYTDDNSPKSINSTVITNFSCEGNSVFTDGIGNENHLNYTASAVFTDGKVSCKYKSHDRFGNSEELSFTADRTIMDELYLLIKKYDLVQYNGISYKVSGLPHGYGSQISIDFDNGEHVYSSNNQTSFLPDSFGIEIYGIIKSYAD